MARPALLDPVDPTSKGTQMPTPISNGCAHSASLPPDVERPPGALRPPEGALGVLRPPGSSSTIGSVARARSGAKDRVARPKARWPAAGGALAPFGAARTNTAARLAAAARAIAAAAAAKPRVAPSPGKPRAATSSTKTAAATSAKTAAPFGAAVAAGYAASAPASTTTKTTTTRGEWDFLKDPKISFDEKLMRFLKLYAQKSEDEVVKKMEEMKGGLPTSSTSSTSASSASSTTSKPKSSGLGGLLKATLGGAVSALADAPAIRGFVKQVSGPVLAAAATAVGLPGLAPVLAQGGPKVADLLLDAADGLGKSLSGSTTSSASSGSATGASTTAAEPKKAESEKAQLIELEYLVEKQKEAFTALSNMLRANHEMRMSAVQNLR
jgi:hypothetical protein